MTDLDKAVERLTKDLNTSDEYRSPRYPHRVKRLVGEEDFRVTLTALSAKSAELEKVREADRAWVELSKRTGWEISFCGFDDDAGWVVHSVSGGINDREWTELARADTPLAAIRQALGETND